RAGDLPAGTPAAGAALGHGVEVVQPAEPLHPLQAVLEGGGGVGALPGSPEPAGEGVLADPYSPAGATGGDDRAGEPRGRVRSGGRGGGELGCHMHQSLTAPAVTPAATKRCATTMRDRKSTRLNSSHVKISYAVFCLKKKTKIP